MFSKFACPLPQKFPTTNNLNDVKVPKNNLMMKSKSSVLLVNFLGFPNSMPNSCTSNHQTTSNKNNRFRKRTSAKKNSPTKIAQFFNLSLSPSPSRKSSHPQAMPRHPPRRRQRVRRSWLARCETSISEIEMYEMILFNIVI